MNLAIYALVLSGIYFVIAVCDHDLASGLTVGFVALLVVPESLGWLHNHNRNGRA